MPSISKRVFARTAMITLAAGGFSAVPAVAAHSYDTSSGGVACHASEESDRNEPKKASASEVKLPAVLHRIAECESGSDPKAVSANGLYRGKDQFHRSTWKAMGGKGDPAEAPESEQDRRALRLYRAQGTAPWPVCGR